MTGEELLTRAATILLDDAHVRWPLPELVNWINDGMRAIVLAKPSANSQSVVLTLTTGTLQSLTTASHLHLLRLPCNITSEGPPKVRGRMIRPTTRELLDASAPDWHNSTETPYKKEVRQYTYDEANPREFYVYPGNDATGKVEALVSVLPTLLTASGDPNLIASYAANLGLPETYPIVLLDYVLYRAFAKDDMPADVTRARLHYMAFANALGIKIQVENVNSPNTRAKVAST